MSRAVLLLRQHAERVAERGLRLQQPGLQIAHQRLDAAALRDVQAEPQRGRRARGVRHARGGAAGPAARAAAIRCCACWSCKGFSWRAPLCGCCCGRPALPAAVGAFYRRRARLAGAVLGRLARGVGVACVPVECEPLCFMLSSLAQLSETFLAASGLPAGEPLTLSAGRSQDPTTVAALGTGSSQKPWALATHISPGRGAMT